MTTPRVRPRFELELPDDPDAVMVRLRGRLSECPNCTGVSVGRHAELFVPQSERRVWSPWLSVTAEAARDGGSLVRGRFAPQPQVWTLYMFLAFGLILVKAPSPMLVAVGMYLPFHSTAAIFVGGIIKWILESSLKKNNASVEQKTKAENTGVLISSGLIAGESLTAVILAFVVAGVSLSQGTFQLSDYVLFEATPWLGILAFVGLFYLLIQVPLQIFCQ